LCQPLERERLFGGIANTKSTAQIQKLDFNARYPEVLRYIRFHRALSERFHLKDLRSDVAAMP
jgi:hypothetical protein